MQDCQRKYFFQYLVSRLPENFIEPQLRRNVLFLKQLTNQYFLLGKILHEQISFYLDTLSHPRPYPLNKLIQDGWQQLLKQIEFSEKEFFLTMPSTAKNFTVLWETVYRQPVTEDQKGILYKKLKKSLRNLTLLTTIRKLKENAFLHLVEKENLTSFVFKNVTIWLKLDLLLRDASGKLIIIDWKLSPYDKKWDYLQLLIYGWYVQQRFQIPPEKIHLQNIYLYTHTEQNFVFSQELARYAVTFFKNTLENLIKLETEARQMKSYRQLPLANDSRNCSRCPFLKICFPKGMVQQNNLDNTNRKTTVYSI